MRDFESAASTLDGEAPEQQQAPDSAADPLTEAARHYLAAWLAKRELWRKIRRDQALEPPPPDVEAYDHEQAIYGRYDHKAISREFGRAELAFMSALWDERKHAVEIDGHIVGARLDEDGDPESLECYVVPRERVHRPRPAATGRRAALLVEAADLEADPEPKGQTYAAPARRYLAAVYAWRAYWRAENARDEDARRRTGNYPTKEEEEAYRERHGHDVIQEEYFEAEHALRAALKEHHARGVEVGGKLIFMVDPEQEGGSSCPDEEFQIVSAGDIVKVF